MLFEHLPEDVQAELLDEKFNGKIHGHMAPGGCYRYCKGPLCKWAVRVKAREAYRRKRLKAGKFYVEEPHVQNDPALEILLSGIYEWHREEMAKVIYQRILAS